MAAPPLRLRRAAVLLTAAFILISTVAVFFSLSSPQPLTALLSPPSAAAHWTLQISPSLPPDPAHPDFAEPTDPDFADPAHPDFTGPEHPDLAEPEHPDFAESEHPDFTEQEHPDFIESRHADFKEPPPVTFLPVANSAIIAPPLTALGSKERVNSSIGGELTVSSPRRAVRPLSQVDRELLNAKREIERAPVVVDDPELYGPLFKNVSVFKRSYEMMEKTLKVYIYRDGSKPIFHQPDLKGIYASEGWFMKLMEGSKRFAVKDPNRAHLFYLPYGARQLELTLYVPGSHNLKPLLVYMKNYIDMLSAKYPFWNRTRGSDHFYVACHDWGPYTTKLHDELRTNTIKALCNADVSEGIFVRGKDVSLPETSIRIPRRPYRDIGGKPVSDRSILAFFAGNMHGRVRPILLQHWQGKDDDMKIYGPLPGRIAKKMSYIQHMKSSKFCICPMGYEVNSPRIAEAIYYECVPVIIADNFVPPFDEVLDWSAFSLTVAEKDIPELKNILLGISLSRYISMQMNVKRLQKHFLWHARPVKYDIFHMILHSIWFSRLHQIQTEL